MGWDRHICLPFTRFKTLGQKYKEHKQKRFSPGGCGGLRARNLKTPIYLCGLVRASRLRTPEKGVGVWFDFFAAGHPSVGPGWPICALFGLESFAAEFGKKDFGSPSCKNDVLNDNQDCHLELGYEKSEVGSVNLCRWGTLLNPGAPAFYEAVWPHFPKWIAMRSTGNCARWLAQEQQKRRSGPTPGTLLDVLLIRQ